MFLIYPYWNVNEWLKGVGQNVKRVSNLSILECKLKISIIIATKKLCF